MSACDLTSVRYGNVPAGPADRIAPPPLPDTESAELAAYYRRLEASLLAQGLLRRDGGGVDTPFTDVQLAQNFVRIALFEEYTDRGGVLNAQQSVSKLRRWDEPIRMRVEFSETFPADVSATDKAAILGFTERLTRITGLPIRQVNINPNFHVLVLNEAERRAFEPRLRAIFPGISESSVRAFVDLPRDQQCIVIGTFDETGATYSRAVALIRAEHPDLLRLSCYHEEIAQGLGLGNDSPRARPSIFNDDEEFGLLTTHDELLLQMLYDPRLVPGMTAAEAAPIARQIAAEIMAGTM